MKTASHDPRQGLSLAYPRGGSGGTAEQGGHGGHGGTRRRTPQPRRATSRNDLRIRRRRADGHRRPAPDDRPSARGPASEGRSPRAPPAVLTLPRKVARFWALLTVPWVHCRRRSGVLALEAARTGRGDGCEDGHAGHRSATRATWGAETLECARRHQRDERSARIACESLISSSTGERRHDTCPALPFWSNTTMAQRATGPTEQ